MRVLSLFLFLSFFFVPDLYAADCGGVVICECGDRVTQDYTLAADLGPCLSTHGLLIGSGVILDGNGHRLLGPGGTSEVYGVYLSATMGAVVKNLVVSGFLRGIRLSNAQGNQILNNETVQNGNFTTHVGYGIDMASGAKNNLLQGNLIHNNADEGIHFGSGSGENVFVNNAVYDNYLENIYFISSDNNTVLNNRTRLGQTSVYLKDSTGNVLQDNIFQDRIVHIRGDSYHNEFINNTLVNTGFHFQVYTSDTPFRYPHDNTVRGGAITFPGGTCFRFSSSWDNLVIGTVLNGCSTDLRLNSDAALSRNTILGVAFSPTKVQLEGSSVLAVGWRLNVQVRDVDDNSLKDVRIKVSDAAGRALFDGSTDPDGNIVPQDVIAYLKTNTAQTAFTPLTIEAQKAGFQSITRQITLAGDLAVTMALIPAAEPVNSFPIADAGEDQSILLFDEVSLNGSRSRDPDGDLLTYEWDFGDGGTASGVRVLHTYTAAGVYTAILTVSDGHVTSTDSVMVVVVSPSPQNSPPVSKAGLDQTVSVGQQVLFDGGDSMDSDGDPLSFTWDFGDGDLSSGVRVAHSYTLPGLYRVTLTVSDGRLSASDFVTVTVEEAGETYLISDAFDRPNSSLLGNGWVEALGNLVIAQHELRTDAFKGLHLAVLPRLLGSSQTVAVDFASVDNNPAPRFGIILRYRDPLNYYLLYRQAGGTSALRISRIQNGKETILASTAIANPAKQSFFRLKGAISGPTLTLELEGGKQLVTSDTTFSAGAVGLALGSGAMMSYRADNFRMTSQ